MKAFNSWMEADPARKAQLLRIEALVAELRNPDTFSASDAADRLMAGEAAFWRRTDYSDQFTGMVCSAANRCGDLQEALTACYWRAADDRVAEAMLDEMIPLGQIAVRQLDAAYRMLGTFRSFADLVSREAKVVPASAGEVA